MPESSVKESDLPSETTFLSQDRALNLTLRKEESEDGVSKWSLSARKIYPAVVGGGSSGVFQNSSSSVLLAEAEGAHSPGIIMDMLLNKANENLEVALSGDYALGTVEDMVQALLTVTQLRIDFSREQRLRRLDL